MNKKYCIYILSVIMIITTIAAAVPANPAPFTLTQPDGTTLQAKQTGDERQSHFETLEGYTIIKNLDGYWVYALINENVLLPTQDKVGNANINNLTIKKHLAPLRIINNGQDDHTVNRISRSISSSSTTIGTTKTLTILIGFTDKSPLSNHTSSYYDNLLFSTSPGAKSLINYYKEVSYNQLNIIGAASPKWYISSHTMSYYGKDSYSGIDDANGEISDLVKEAISLANIDIDFSQYDGDGDGFVDHLIVIHAGNDQSGTGISNDIWSHQSSLNMQVDGVQIKGYTLLAETSPLGTFVHEFGHDIGLPDMYNTDTGASVVRDWDLMDHGSWNNNGATPAHPSAWNKIQLGWINPLTVTTQTTVNISQLETNQNNSVYKVSSSTMPSTEYFLVENRQKTGYDSYLPDDGIVIWHIDDAQGSLLYNDVNNGVIKRVAVEDASNGLTPFLQGAAYSSEDHQITFSPTSRPSSNSNSGLSTGISIDNIGSSASSMSVSIPASIPPPIQNVSLMFSGGYNTGNAWGVAVSGSYAYIADLFNGLVILDVSNQTSPKLAGNYNTTGVAWGVAVSGSYAYVANGVSGLVILDVSNQTSPKLAGSYNTAGDASGVAVSGNYAYVADYNNGLVIIDVTNPAAPRLAGSYNTAGYAWSVAVSGGYAYVADGVSGLVIIDVSNPAAPKLTGSFNTAGDASGVAVSGSYAYVADYDNGLVIIDVTNPAAPKLAGSYNTAGYAWGVAVSGNYAYVADYNNGLVIIDVSNLAAPKLVGSYNTAGYAWGVAVSGSYAYVADGLSGLVVLSTGTTLTEGVIQIIISPSSVSMQSGQIKQFTVTGKDARGKEVIIMLPIWTSSKPSVGTISSTGVFTALGSGTTTVTATSGSVTGSAIVMVGTISQGTVMRSLSSTTVAPDATVTITIIPANLPAGAYYTYETIPAGFTFVNSTAFGNSNVGNIYTLKQSGATAFTYIIKAPAAIGTYAISGTFKDIDLNIGTVGGSATVSVSTFSVETYLPPAATPAERKAGLIRAMDDYFDNGALTKPELLSVLDAYFA